MTGFCYKEILNNLFLVILDLSNNINIKEEKYFNYFFDNVGVFLIYRS
jgi:hypothetical protein